jgi:hypothetical protein
MRDYAKPGHYAPGASDSPERGEPGVGAKQRRDRFPLRPVGHEDHAVEILGRKATSAQIRLRCLSLKRRKVEALVAVDPKEKTHDAITETTLTIVEKHGAGFAWLDG